MAGLEESSVQEEERLTNVGGRSPSDDRREILRGESPTSRIRALIEVGFSIGELGYDDVLLERLRVRR